MTRTQALVLAGHGSQRHPDTAAPLHAHADRIRARGGFDEVRTAFWKEEPALGDVSAVVASDVAYVVPVLTSEGYFADEVFPRELGGDGARPDAPDVRYAEPVGTHEAMAAVVAERVEATVGESTAAVGVALVGHGTERNERSAAATRRHAARLRELGRYAEVAALFLDEAPRVGEVLDVLHATELVVVPLFVADGYHTTRDIPETLGHPGVGQAAWLDGRRVHLTGAVGTEPRLADVVLERAVEAGATPRAASASRERSDAERAFVAAVDASPVDLEWGELTVRGSDGSYALRHRDDADAAEAGLDSLPGPAALRRHVRHDDEGRYRPLSGARSLQTGWTLEGLDGPELARAVRAVYPGSVSLWYREREGTLDATPFETTAARQTGLLAGVGSLGPAERVAAVKAVCGDCVRQRRWPTGDGGKPRAPEEGGAIPCREACPFLLSAAHAFVGEEGDTRDEPSPETPVGAFGEPGNRYRVRYARALARQARRGVAGAGGDR